MANLRTSLLHEIRRVWKPRARESHKGDFGHVLILAGSKGMAGAASMVGLAALRTGTGRVTLAVPESIESSIIRKAPELMVHGFPSNPEGYLSLRALPKIKKLMTGKTLIACGPGLSRNPQTQRLVRKLAKASKLPWVLDADGLLAFQNHLLDLKALQGRAILTPHPGEFCALFGGRVQKKSEERKKQAVQIAQRFQLTMVLKGAGTVVADPTRVFINPTGNPGLAKGGSGDVLTGMIAGLAAQGMNLWQSARFGVFLHGLAADQAVKKTGEASLMARDLLEVLPQILYKVRGR